MAQNPTAGWGSYLNYGYEATYGTPASGTRVFGDAQKITLTRKNTEERLYGVGARNATVSIAKKYEGSASIEFVLANASFFRAALGAVADGGSGPSSFTHTYTEANVLPSFSIVDGTELGTNDDVHVIAGAKINTWTLSATVGETVKMRIDCPYKTETQATSGIGSQVAETADAYTFAGAVLQLPSGSTIGNVQTIELTGNHNIEGLWGLGSRIKTAQIEKAREYNIKMTVAFSQASDLLTKFFGQATGPLTVTNPASTATLILTLTSSTDTMVMTFANIYLDTETLPKDVNEILKEDVEGWALSCTSVIVTNSTATDAGNP